LRQNRGNTQADDEPEFFTLCHHFPLSDIGEQQFAVLDFFHSATKVRKKVKSEEKSIKNRTFAT
jgi:hypothetical protein